MGFLDRMFNQAPSQPVWFELEADVVGEGHYQDAIASIVGPKTEEGYCVPVSIELRREPSNPYDRNAVQCLVNGRLVGYINRDAAPALQTVLRGYEQKGAHAMAPGYIAGGWRRRDGNEGHYGVRLGPSPEQDLSAGPPKSGSRRQVGMYAGKHYTEYVELVKQLKRDGDLDAAEKLLLHLLTAVEEESAAEGHTPAPWYYDQLMIVYRKQKWYDDEICVVGRHRAQLRIFGFDAEQEELARLRKAIALRDAQRASQLQQ